MVDTPWYVPNSDLQKDIRIKDVARKIVGKPEFRTLTALTKRFELL